MRSIAGLGVCVLLGMASAMAQQTPQATTAPSKAWIAVSDAYTQQLLAVQLKHHPEGGSAEGLAQFDEQVSNPTLADFQAERKETEALLPKLKAAEATEQDKNVREDLAILQKAIDLQIRSQDYDEQHDIDFMNASEQIFGGLKTLLDDQVPAGRQNAAVVRLRKYAASEPRFTPLTEILKRRETDKMAKPGMLYPSRDEIETELGRDQAIWKAYLIVRQVQAHGLARAVRETEDGADGLRRVGAGEHPAQGADRFPAAARRICVVARKVWHRHLRRRRLPPQAHAAFTRISGADGGVRRDRSPRRMDGLPATIVQ